MSGLYGSTAPHTVCAQCGAPVVHAVYFGSAGGWVGPLCERCAALGRGEDRARNGHADVMASLRALREDVNRLARPAIPWRRVADGLPEEGEWVLTFGRVLPDGIAIVGFERIVALKNGVAYWGASDEVTHWCPLSDVPTPEEP